MGLPADAPSLWPSPPPTDALAPKGMDKGTTVALVGALT
jgi:hypothetical protein